MATSRIGVFGGTFNPIHRGHLCIAAQAKRTFNLDRIYFVIAAVPPHKPQRNLLSLSHRQAMVALATIGSPTFIPSMIELQEPASSYSLHTIAKIKRQERTAGSALYFIAGGDSLRDVKTWWKSDQLLESCNFVFARRPGIETAVLDEVLPSKLLPRVHNLVGMSPRESRRVVAREQRGRRKGVFLADFGAPPISSSEIRDRLSQGRMVRPMLPPAVHEYIHKLNLYGAR